MVFFILGKQGAFVITYQMEGAMRAITKLPERSLAHVHALAIVVHCQHRTFYLVTDKTRFPLGVVAFSSYVLKLCVYL
jgi:hypothetical protein